jgi:hypothetical protein
MFDVYCIGVSVAWVIYKPVNNKRFGAIDVMFQRTSVVSYAFGWKPSCFIGEDIIQELSSMGIVVNINPLLHFVY